MTRTKSRIRHDYKPLTPSTTAQRGRPATLLPAAFAAAGLVVAAAAFILLKPATPQTESLVSEQDNVAAVTADEVKTVTAALPPPISADAAPEPVETAQAPTPDAQAAEPVVDDDYVRGIPVELPLPPPQNDGEAALLAPVEEPGELLRLTIKSGNTLDGLFGRHGLSRGDLVTLLRDEGAKEGLAKLMPGDEVLIRHEDSRVLSLTRALDEERTLHVTRNDDGFSSRLDVNPVERVTTHADGTIESSLFLSAKAAGISDNLAMKLAGIYAWDIDFVLDIRRGDRFTLIYEEIWQDGEKIRDGDIIAAEFVNSGDAFPAARYTDPDGNVGYFTPEGNNMRKAFIRAPIAISPRVTSNFNPRRMHPVHKKVRPHRGVDYGAPTGTPIKAAGDGKVIFRGRKGGYGNTIILQDRKSVV